MVPRPTVDEVDRLPKPEVLKMYSFWDDLSVAEEAELLVLCEAEYEEYVENMPWDEVPELLDFDSWMVNQGYDQ